MKEKTEAFPGTRVNKVNNILKIILEYLQEISTFWIEEPKDVAGCPSIRHQQLHRFHLPLVWSVRSFHVQYLTFMGIIGVCTVRYSDSSLRFVFIWVCKEMLPATHYSASFHSCSFALPYGLLLMGFSIITSQFLDSSSLRTKVVADNFVLIV